MATQPKTQPTFLHSSRGPPALNFLNTLHPSTVLGIDEATLLRALAAGQVHKVQLALRTCVQGLGVGEFWGAERQAQTPPSTHNLKAPKNLTPCEMSHPKI